MFGHKYERTDSHGGFGHNCKRYWGARAIYKNEEVEFLWDRQSAKNLDEHDEETDKEGLTEFLVWLEKTAIPWIKKKVKDISLAIDDPQELKLSDGDYELRASTHQSHGYLYIGATEGNVE